MRVSALRSAAAIGLGVAAGLMIAMLAGPGAAYADADVAVDPASVAPGAAFTVIAGCGAEVTGASVSGTSFGGPSEIALERFTDGGPGAFMATLTVPGSTGPGSYPLQVTCDDGESGSGTLVVAPTGVPAGIPTPEEDRQAMIVGSAALMLVAAVAGFIYFRRRSS